MRSLLALAFVLGSLPLFGSDNVLSMAAGIDGVRDIVGSQLRQEEIEVSPPQLSDLKSLASSRRVSTIYSEAFQREISSGKDFRQSQLAATREVDKQIRAEIESILQEGQLTARRQKYLRSKFPSAANVFDDDFLRQLELSSAEITAVTEAIQPQLTAMLDELDNQRRQALEKGLAIAPEHSRIKYYHLLGALFISNVSSPSVPAHSVIAIVPESRPLLQLSKASALPIPKGLERTSSQNVSIINVLQKYSVLRTKDRSFNYDVQIDAELDEILRPDQRVAIVQGLHQQLLRDNLRFLIRPEVVKYVELPSESQARMQASIEESDLRIREIKSVAGKKIFSVGVAALPKGLRPQVSRLFEGVWTD